MEHDLTFVAPERRDEVRRRLAAIERFLANPGRRMAEQCAAELGLRHGQFYNLVRAWRASGRPELVDPGRRPARGSTMSAKQQRIVDEVIAEDIRAPIGELIKRVLSAAEASGVRMPHLENVTRRVRSGRPSLLTKQVKNELDLLVDHTVLDLPVDYGGGDVRRPLATMVIDVASDAIVGLALARGTPSPESTAAALADAARPGLCLDGRRTPGRQRVGIVAMAEDETAGIIDILERAGFDSDVRLTGAHGSGRGIEALLGSHRAEIWLKPRLVWSYPDRRSVSPRTGRRALAPEEALALARGRLRDASVASVFGQLDEGARLRLISDLMRAAHPGSAGAPE